MTSRRKTWQEKLADKPAYPKVIALQAGFPCYNALHKMGVEVGDPVVLVNPSEVVALWIIFAYLLLNTLGNLASGSVLEKLVFIPITILAALLVVRLPVESSSQTAVPI